MARSDPACARGHSPLRPVRTRAFDPEHPRRSGFLAAQAGLRSDADRAGQQRLAAARRRWRGRHRARQAEFRHAGTRQFRCHPARCRPRIRIHPQRTPRRSPHSPVFRPRTCRRSRCAAPCTSAARMVRRRQKPRSRSPAAQPRGSCRSRSRKTAQPRSTRRLAGPARHGTRVWKALCRSLWRLRRRPDLACTQSSRRRRPARSKARALEGRPSSHRQHHGRASISGG